MSSGLDKLLENLGVDGLKVLEDEVVKKIKAKTGSDPMITILLIFMILLSFIALVLGAYLFHDQLPSLPAGIVQNIPNPFASDGAQAKGEPVKVALPDCDGCIVYLEYGDQPDKTDSFLTPAPPIASANYLPGKIVTEGGAVEPLGIPWPSKLRTPLINVLVAGIDPAVVNDCAQKTGKTPDDVKKWMFEQIDRYSVMADWLKVVVPVWSCQKGQEPEAKDYTVDDDGSGDADYGSQPGGSDPSDPDVGGGQATSEAVNVTPTFAPIEQATPTSGFIYFTQNAKSGDIKNRSYEEVIEFFKGEGFSPEEAVAMMQQAADNGGNMTVVLMAKRVENKPTPPPSYIPTAVSKVDPPKVNKNKPAPITGVQVVPGQAIAQNVSLSGGGGSCNLTYAPSGTFYYSGLDRSTGNATFIYVVSVTNQQCVYNVNVAFASVTLSIDGNLQNFYACGDGANLCTASGSGSSGGLPALYRAGN